MKKGFTLIEVLVVVVIVAILAAIAVPSYKAYIDDSKNSAAKQSAETVARVLTVEYATIGTVTDPAGTVSDKVQIPEEITYDDSDISFVHKDNGTKKYTVVINDKKTGYKVLESDL